MVNGPDAEYPSIAEDSPPGDKGGNGVSSQEETALEALREILLRQYKERIVELEHEVESLEQRIHNQSGLAATIAPIVGDAIRRKIRDARDEMIEILYPVIGETITRAVGEAIRDLARNIDAQMRRSFNFQLTWQRLQGQIKGVSGTEMILRESLPFEVTELFLIHRETGILLLHLSNPPYVASDSDLISGMLTAIGDFTKDSFGQGREGQLDEIQYGELRIIVEAATHVYMAVVIDGIEPPGYQAEMRERTFEIGMQYEKQLKEFEGDTAPFEALTPVLKPLMQGEKPQELSLVQKRIMAAMITFLVVCVVGTCFVGNWAWGTVQTIQALSSPVVMVVTATPKLETPTPTVTPTFVPTLTPTITPTPAFIPGQVTGRVWLRQAPSISAAGLGLALEQGESVEVLAATGDWYYVGGVTPSNDAVRGWVSARWVKLSFPVPPHLVTPVAEP